MGAYSKYASYSAAHVLNSRQSLRLESQGVSRTSLLEASLIHSKQNSRDTVHLVVLLINNHWKKKKKKNTMRHYYVLTLKCWFTMTWIWLIVRHWKWFFSHGTLLSGSTSLYCEFTWPLVIYKYLNSWHSNVDLAWHGFDWSLDIENNSLAMELDFRATSSFYFDFTWP